MNISRRIFLRICTRQVFLARSFVTEKNILKSPADNIKNIPKNVLLQDYFIENISKVGDRIAVECIETKRKYTGLEILNKSLALAHFLKYNLKLEENSTVGILLPNLPEFAIIMIGALRAGLTITTINPIYTQGEIKKQLVHSNAKALFTLAEMEQVVAITAKELEIPIIAAKLTGNSTLSKGTINLFDIINSDHSFEEIRTKYVTPEDVAFLPYSSGTTGIPKGVELTHNNVVANLEQTISKEFTSYVHCPDEIVLAFVPFYHIYGLSFLLSVCLCLGVKVISFPKFTSNLFLKGLREHRPTFIPVAPPVIHLINNNPHINPSEDLASLHSIMCGAAPLGATDMERFHDITQGKIDLVQGYGMTESSPLTIKQTTYLKGGLKIGGSGFLVPNTEAKFISVENSQGNLGPNEVGQLMIRGPQVMKGYLNNPEATKNTITEDSWLITGDIGYYDEDGHIFITDRLKELIKVQGFQVAPAELEAVLRTYPSVEDVAVVGVDHERYGEAPRAFIVTKRNSQVKSEDIQEFVASRLAKFKHLTGGVVFVDSIPRNPSGKILRKDLKKVQ